MLIKKIVPICIKKIVEINFVQVVRAKMFWYILINIAYTQDIIYPYIPENAYYFFKN